MTFVEDN